MEVIGGPITLKQIFLCRQAWLVFWATNLLRLRWAVIWNVGKMLLCRTGWGYMEYACRDCSTIRRVPFTCKSRFCSSCGKAAVDRWVETTLSAILDVPYQHLIFTIPEELRLWLKVNRKKGLDALFLAVKNTLLTWTDQRGYRPGLISILHTFGADLKWNPHIHVIITCGGLSKDETRWIENKYLPWQCLRPMYRYALLQELKKLFKNKELKSPPGFKHLKTYNDFNRYLTPLYKKEWFISLGKSLEEAEPSIRYAGRYCKRPVMAESNITAFDGENVSFQYKDRATNEKTTLTLPVQEFIGRLVQHIPDPHFRILRHAGIFANCIRAKKLKIARTILEQHAKPKPPRIPWREMLQETYKTDPLACSICGGIMQLIKLEFVSSGGILERVQNKHQELKDNLRATKTQKKQIPEKPSIPKLSDTLTPSRAPPQRNRHLLLPQL